MDARCSRGAENPPANPLNFKLTHMLGCLRTIIIIMVPMITLMMKLFPIAPDDDEVCLAVLFFRHSPFFFFSFFSLPVCQIVNGYQGREGTSLLWLQFEIPAEIANLFGLLLVFCFLLHCLDRICRLS